MKKKKLKVIIKVGDKEITHLMKRDVIPEDDAILNDFSAHYQYGQKRKLPATAKVISVEEL